MSSSVQRNEGTDPRFKNNPNAMVPYSVAKYIAQVFHSAQCGVKPRLGFPGATALRRQTEAPTSAH